MEAVDFLTMLKPATSHLLSPFAQWWPTAEPVHILEWPISNNPRPEILFFSDVHLQAKRPEQIRQFATYIEQLCETQAIGLIISVGDCFDWWYGPDPYFEKLYQPFTALLEKLFRKWGLRWIFLEGNHDINLAALEKQRSYVKVIPNELWLNVTNEDGKKNLCHLSHGDLVNDQDKGYLKLRRLLRTGSLKKISSFISAPLIFKLGQSLSNLSRDRQGGEYSPTKVRSTLFDSTLAKALENYLQQISAQGALVAIMGHLHEKKDVRFEFKQNIRSINLGYFQAHHTFLKYQRGTFEWVAAPGPGN